MTTAKAEEEERQRNQQENLFATEAAGPVTVGSGGKVTNTQDYVYEGGERGSSSSRRSNTREVGKFGAIPP